MTKQLLFAHWKASRWLLLPFVLLGFGLPLLVYRFAELLATEEGINRGAAMIEGARVWGPLFPLLAFSAGAALALAGWNWDHRANHVYALSLPIQRSRYVLQKLAVGALLVVIPALAVWLGSFLSVALNELPEGVRAYPVSFGARFLVAALLAYALTFAMASGTIRTTVIIVSALLIVLVFGSILVSYLRVVLDQPNLATPVDLLISALGYWPGPFSVFGGNWNLIDV